jgi:hypothetical protein
MSVSVGVVQHSIKLPCDVSHMISSPRPSSRSTSHVDEEGLERRLSGE